MLLSFSKFGRTYSFDTANAIDISIPLRAGSQNAKAFYAGDPRIEPMQAGSFIGDVLQGGSCNVNEVFLNVHCNGTHTECIGHISKEKHSLNQCLQRFLFFAQVISVTPEKINDDYIITRDMLARHVWNMQDNERLPEALIIRTLPNDDDKLTRDYSGKNAAYMSADAIDLMHVAGISHLLIDLPSVDKEDDNKLLAHHAWWKYPEHPQTHRTITELIYVANSVADDYYMLNLQVTSLENDASPSKPILYALSS